MTGRAYTIIDVFTDRPLEGNPAAIFDDGSGLTDEVMQRTARELNLSETVFLLPAQGEADAAVRIFTPASELPFAGHPVLGTAFVLAARLGTESIRLETGAGPISIALRRQDGEVVFGEMDQPIPAPEPFGQAGALLAGLRIDRSELPIEAYRNGPLQVYVALPDEISVIDLRPDMGALSDLGDGLGISCFAGRGGRFKTRMFAPALGVPEDPATGSAAGPLALHLARHRRIDYGERIEIRQGAEIRRPSFIYATVEGSANQIDRVVVGGSAVVVASGQYRLD